VKFGLFCNGVANGRTGGRLGRLALPTTPLGSDQQHLEIAMAARIMPMLLLLTPIVIIIMMVIAMPMVSVAMMTPTS
jgi:hypothetical protein